MPRRFRPGASPQASPAAALKTLEHNLRRERHLFTMLTGLLIFAALCLAAIAISGVVLTVLREQRLEARIVNAQANAQIWRHLGILGSAAVALTLEDAPEREAQTDGATSSRCSPTFGPSGGSPDLLAVCERFVAAVKIWSDVPIMLLRVDGSAAYSHGLTVKGSQLPPGEAAHLLADTALLRLAASSQDSLAAGDRLKVSWFRPPSALGFAPNLVLGATPVQKDGKPYAFVITSVDLGTFSRTLPGSASEHALTLLDARGAILDTSLSPAGAQYLDRRVASLPAGLAHIVPRYGLAMREEPLASDFGHYMVALSWSDLFTLTRAPVVLILLLTAALVAMLVMLSRYWNRHVLTHTYDEATRAVEGELLNHLLVHATPVGLCIVRRSNFEIVIANQIVRNVLGLDAQTTRLPNALCAEFERHWPWPALANGDDETPVHELPFSLERPGEVALHLAITYAPATMNREDVMFCAVADMSKHHEAERLLREAKLMSDEAARAKVSFFAAMSHEIRTPLASLVGNIELLARGPLAPEQGARVHAMQVSASELLQIVSDVLDFSKIDVGQMRLNEEAGSVAALLERIALAHAPLAARQRLPFYLVIDRALPAQLQFDVVRLAQIVNNLLSNAFKFTQSGKIVLHARWHDDAVEISVSDSGCGIPADLKKQLFQPFTQGDDQRFTQARGTGLGLSICARLASLMRGRVEIDSAPGVGTRVAVILPLRREGDATAADGWTLPDTHPAILCRAPENREWLGNLFDSRVSTPTFLSSDQPPREGTFDYLLVTNEFSPDDVRLLWSDAAKIVWLRQDGPLVPVALDGGGAEVSLYSLSGIRAATQMLRPGTAVSTAALQSATNRPAEEGEFPSLTALIAEDNLLNRGLLRDQLRTLGAKVVEAKDGEEALARLDGQNVDLVFTDLNMPVMNGYQLLEAARKRYPDLPIYAVSSNALPEQIAQGRAMGFTDYLSKPVTLADLARVLAAVATQAASTPKPEAQTASESQTSAETELPRFPALAPEIVSIFVEQADHDIADYTEIARQRDVKRLRDWAHRVSGGLAVLGPSMLNEACLELRSTIREAGAWTEDVDELAAAVTTELAALRTIASPREEN